MWPMNTVSTPTDLSREAFEADGFVHVRQLLDTSDVDAIREAFTAQNQRDHSLLSATEVFDEADVLRRYPRIIQPHRRSDLDVGRIARRYLTDPRIAAVLATLVGPVHGAQSMFYFKPPSARGQAMHQDNYYLRAAPETCYAAWVAVDDCDDENGALSVVPGSHRMEVVCPERADASESFTTDLVRPPEGMTAVQTRMVAGDVLFFHGSLVHGSRPNTSATRFRRSLILHYIPVASVEIAEGYLPLVDLATGGDVRVAAAVGGGPCGTEWTTELD